MPRKHVGVLSSASSALAAKLVLVVALVATACTASTSPVTVDNQFDGTCVKCHLGLDAGHVHPNYKLRCIDCHGGNDQVAVPDDVMAGIGSGSNDAMAAGKFRDPNLIKQAHVLPKKGLARFFFANGVDDNGDGVVDDIFQPDNILTPTQVVNLGEVFQPGLHGEGPGEFVDSELNRDLNYTRFINPGDLRVASIGCGASNRAAIDGGAGGGCHQETVDIVRRSIMVNQAAVTNGAYYGNESWRQAFIDARGNTPDPRAGAFSYALDYDGADMCIDTTATHDGAGGRGQPSFSSQCAETRASGLDATIAAGAPGNVGNPAFEIAANTIGPVNASAHDPGSVPATTIVQIGAGETRYPWGGQPVFDTTAERAALKVIPNADVPGFPGIPDPVDLILRTFRAYYPLNYPGSDNNFNFTFGTSIVPDINHFKTVNPYGRTHGSGCAACHAQYRYDGQRNPTPQLQDDGTTTLVADPTTKHREFQGIDPVAGAAAQTSTNGLSAQDTQMLNGTLQLVGRAVAAQEQVDTGRAQQRGYSADHTMTTAITTDTCGLCHGFVTRINYAYQGMGEEEQRDQLSRRAPDTWTTPAGTQVQILDSWVREETDPTQKQPNGNFVVTALDLPAGLATITAAKKRDADLAAQGFIPGNGGCAANTFTEDCNNDGELETNLVLTKLNPDGSVAGTVTINEDLNGNGKLDLIDRLPRENSIDGRQVRYVYGDRNGSTRLMDIHFQKGMHCIDCHFLQDVHGDGHVYSTNWDHIEIECEDCHGSVARATLKTSGPTGGNDLTKAHDANLQPYFESVNGQIIQHSRVTPGLFWVVPQTSDQAATNPIAKEAHGNNHIGPPGPAGGSTFEGAQGTSKITAAKLECATCHSSWIHNCVGCHVNSNAGDGFRLQLASDLQTLKNKPDSKENEIWFSNQQNEGHIDFQLLSLMRAPFVLGVSSSSEQGRLGTFRSSMQAQASVTDPNGNSIRDNLTFTTFQSIDGNSGRANVATSGVAMNQTMAHTVRPNQGRGCETCHPLVDQDGSVRNEHILAETYGIGTGAMAYVGDWGMAAGTGGIELYDYKADREIATNKKTAKTRFPGIVVSDCDRDPALVEPILDGTSGIATTSTAVDIALVRNFNATPSTAGGTQAPTLRDLAVTAIDTGTKGELLINDISNRGNPGLAGVATGARPALSDTSTSFILDLPARPRAIAHIGPDVSDPFVYVALGTAGVAVVHLDGAPTTGVPSAHLGTVVQLTSGHTANELQLAGDFLYVGTVEGTIDVLDLTDPANPKTVGTPAPVGAQVNGLAIAGFMLYAATPSGVAAFVLDDPTTPAPPTGASSAIIVPGINANELSVSQGHLYVAAGTDGVFDIDVRTPAKPVNNGNIAATIASGQSIDAADVEVSTNPGQVWLLVLDTDGSMWGLKLDGRKSVRERCFPDPKSAGCTLDLPFLDVTQSGRDPSFNPMTQQFDDSTCGDAATNPFLDPSAKPFIHLAATILTGGKRLARPTLWEQIGTLTGRRVRDSFMPGSGVLSLDVMQAMRSVTVCETTNATSNEPGNLNALGYADAGFTSSGTCQPFGTSARVVKPRSKAVCKPLHGNGPLNICGPGSATEAAPHDSTAKAAEAAASSGLLWMGATPWSGEPIR